jgi:hypothetical protein
MLDSNKREHQETPTPGTPPFPQNSKKQKLNRKQELPTLEKTVHWQNAKILNYHPHHPVASAFIPQNNCQGFHAQAFAEKSMNPPLFPPAPSPLVTSNTYYPFTHKQQAHPQTQNTSILPHTLPVYTSQCSTPILHAAFPSQPTPTSKPLLQCKLSKKLNSRRIVQRRAKRNRRQTETQHKKLQEQYEY